MNKKSIIIVILLSIILISFIGITFTGRFLWWPWNQENKINKVSQTPLNDYEKYGYDPGFFEITEEEYLNLRNELFKDENFYQSYSQNNENIYLSDIDFGSSISCTDDFSLESSENEKEKKDDITLKEYGRQLGNDCFWWSVFEIKMEIFGFNPTLKKYKDFLKKLREVGWTKDGGRTPVPDKTTSKEDVQRWINDFQKVDGYIISKFVGNNIKFVDWIWVNYENKAFLNKGMKIYLDKFINQKKGHVILSVKSTYLSSEGKMVSLHAVHSGKVRPDKSCKKTTFIISDPQIKGNPDPKPLEIKVDVNGKVLNQDEVNKRYHYPPGTKTEIIALVGIGKGE